MTHWSMLIGIAIFSFVTFAVLKSTDRYTVELEQLVSDSEFQEGPMFWGHHGTGTVSYNGSSMSLSNASGGSHRVGQRIEVRSAGIYQFTIGVEARDIVVGEKVWQKPSVRLFYRNADGDTIDGDVVARLSGSVGMSQYTKIVKVPSDAQTIDISISLIDSFGTMIVVSPVLSKLHERTVYKTYNAALLSIWAVISIVLLVWLIHSLPENLKLMVKFLVIMGVLGVLLPADIIAPIGEGLAGFFPDFVWSFVIESLGLVWLSVGSAPPAAVVSKLGHLFVFLLIGALAAKAVIKFGFLFIVSSVFLLALVTEVLQIFVDSRNPSFNDLAIDCIAAVIGVWFGVAMNRFLGNRQNR